MSVSIGIVVFPGSNCEQDCDRAFRSLGAETEMIWHGDETLPDVDLVILPGGFAHGDYLRTGAIARFSPIMDSVMDFAASGGLLLGICNGFQVLCEAGLLPGAMRKNAGLKFLCKWTELEVVNTETPFTTRAAVGQKLKIPINHFEGNWYCDDETHARMDASGQIVLRYVDNPNGSLHSIAGICNENGNVLGLMPHPERACEALLGSEDGKVIFGSILDHVGDKASQPA
jgi:phosphoribosylformylglycinamidine synthase subunit PurQ / glutaminase